MALSEKANNVNWLMANFVRSTPGVEQAMAVSSDGLLIALSSQLERASADKMAAIITGMRALAHGGANELAKGQVMQVLIEMANAYLNVSACAFADVADAEDNHRTPASVHCAACRATRRPLRSNP